MTDLMPMLAFADKAKRYPQISPGLDVEIGWWMALVLAALVVWGWSRAPWLRRLFFVHEDPRIFALFRVMLATFTFACFWNLEPYWRFLWSDEGMFTLGEAQARLGRSALSGWTSEDGFLGPWAVAKFFWTKPSLWFLHGSPAYIYGSMWVFFGLLFAYAIGFRTRVTGVLCWLMLISVYNRNAFYLEGTDTVYRVLWFYALFMRSGDAWSVDNVIRVARERRAQAKLAQGAFAFDLGRFADRLLSLAWLGGWGWLIAVQLDMHFDDPMMLGLLGVSLALAEGWWAARRTRAHGAEVVQRYRGVPRWPRLLIMVQYALLYCNTGSVKTGVVWMRGDALYYALNLDHFYRFDGFTQWFSAYFGTNFFRLATWLTHFWEIGFPLLLVGMWLGYRRSQAGAAWSIEGRARLRHRVGSICLIVIWAAVGIAMVKSLPYLFPLNNKDAATMPAFVVATFSWVWGLGLPALLGVLWGLGRWAPTIPAWGIKRLRVPAITIDTEFLRAWLLGRRTWLFLGLLFHGFLMAFMNIGMFPFIMLGGYIAFTSARPWLKVFRYLHQRAPGYVADGKIAAALADRAPGEQIDAINIGRRGGAFVSDAWVLVFAGAVLGLILARGQAPQFWGALGTLPASLFAMIAVVGLGAYRWRHGHTLASVAAFLSLVCLGIAYSEQVTEMAGGDYKAALGRGMHVVLVVVTLVGCAYGFRRRERPAEAEPVAGHSGARTLAFCFALFHVSAVSAVLFPNFPIWGTWQSPSRRVFGGYLRGTKTNQSWKMFAPNPPRANSFSRTVLVDGEDVHWDLHNNSYTTRPAIFWANDRMRKMQRRLIGKGKWYVRYWTNFHCREWELATGVAPKEVQVYKIVTRIPKPKQSKYKPWNPRKTKVTTTFVQKHNCGDQGALTPDMKTRRGLPLTEADEKALEKEAQKAERESKTRREAWDRRRDYGGEGPPAVGGFVAKGSKGASAKRASLPAPAKPKAPAPAPVANKPVTNKPSDAAKPAGAGHAQPQGALAPGKPVP